MVIKAILESNGIPVWAHPFGGTGERERTIAEFEAQLKILVYAGLKGLECYYSKYEQDQVGLLVSYADKNGLLISGGSDYHGKNKKVSLGELKMKYMQSTDRYSRMIAFKASLKVNRGIRELQTTWMLYLPI